jgi:hypothetical protein
LAALLLLTFASALELLARTVLAPPIYLGTFPFEPELGYRAQNDYARVNFDERGAFSFRLNSEGFRGAELPAPGTPKVAGTQRVLFLGDSFVNAWAVRAEEHMAEVTRRILAARGIASEPFVLGCSDYGTAQELLLLERHGERLRPDAVVLALYPANDVANNALVLAGQVETSAGDYVRPYFVPDGAGGFARTFAQPLRALLRSHSKAFARLDRALIVRGERAPFRWYAPWPLRHPWVDERLAADRAPAEWLEVFRPHAPGEPWEEAWEVTRALLAAVQARCQALGARLLVLVIPCTQQVEVNGIVARTAHELEAAGAGAYLAALDLALPERRLLELGRALGFEVLAALEPLRAQVRASGASCYAGDGHWNGRAHAVAGALVAGWLAGDEAAPAARALPEDSRPVPLVPAFDDSPRWLQLEGPVPFLAGGWHAELDGARLCWAAAERAAILVPLEPGETLALEGWRPAHAPSCTLILEVPGIALTSCPLPPGAFRIELALGPAALAAGLWPVALTFDATYAPAPDDPADWRRFGARITGIGTGASEGRARALTGR